MTKLLTHDGTTLTLSGWARELGLSATGFIDRVKRGLSPDKLFRPKIERAERASKIGIGDTFMTRKEWAKKLGIGLSTLSYRLTQEWPDDLIFAMPKRTPAMLTHNGKTQSIAEWAKELGVPRSLIDSRIARGHKGDKLFYPGYRPRTRWNPITLTYNGKTQTLKEWSRELGIAYETLWFRLIRGKTPEQILRTHGK